MRPPTPKQPQSLQSNPSFEVRKSAKFEIDENVFGHGYKDALLKDYPLADGSCVESLSLRHLLYDSDLGWSCIFAMLRLVYGCDLKDENGIGAFLTESDRTELELEKDRFVKLVIRWLMSSKAAREIDLSAQNFVMHFYPVSTVPFPPPHAYPWSKFFHYSYSVFFACRIPVLEQLDLADLHDSSLVFLCRPVSHVCDLQ